MCYCTRYVGFKCADDYYTSIDMPTALRFSDEAAHADQARLQESEAHPGDLRHQYLPWRLLGRPGLQLVRRQLSAGILTRRQHIHRRSHLLTKETTMKAITAALMSITLLL